MNNYHHLYNQAELRRAELIHEAETDRLINKPVNPGLSDRVLSGLGEWMINEGTRLKQRGIEPESTQKASYSWLTANR